MTTFWAIMTACYALVAAGHLSVAWGCPIAEIQRSSRWWGAATAVGAISCAAMLVRGAL